MRGKGRQGERLHAFPVSYRCGRGQEILPRFTALLSNQEHGPADREHPPSPTSTQVIDHLQSPIPSERPPTPTRSTPLLPHKTLHSTRNPSPLSSLRDALHTALARAMASSLRTTALRRLAAANPTVAHRSLSSTPRRLGGDAHAHGDHYDPPTGWLFGVAPGKYQPEGWEKIWFWGFFGSLGLATVAWCYKPDTRYVDLFCNCLKCGVGDGARDGWRGCRGWKRWTNNENGG